MEDIQRYSNVDAGRGRQHAQSQMTGQGSSDTSSFFLSFNKKMSGQMEYNPDHVVRWTSEGVQGNAGERRLRCGNLVTESREIPLSG